MQGPEFQSLLGQAVDTIQQEVAKALQRGGTRGSRGTSKLGDLIDSNERTTPELHEIKALLGGAAFVVSYFLVEKQV